MQLRKVKILLTLVLLIFINEIYGQAPIGRWSIGITGSAEYFLRTLKDAERFDIDSSFVFGMTDKEYIEERNAVDKPYFPGKTFGVLMDYRLNSRLNLETGLRFVEGGSKVAVSDFTNYQLISEFGIENLGETVISKYHLLEVPFIIRQRLGRANKFDLGKRKTGSRLTNMYRHFFVSYGLGIGVPINGSQFYNGIEYYNITGNMGIAAVGGIGFHLNTRSPFFFNVRAHGRATLLSYYEYAPVKTYLNALGAEIKLGYRFPYERKEEKNRKPTDCASFTDAPDVSSRPKLVFGMKYGAQANFVLGNSTQDQMIGFNGLIPATELQVETATGELQTIFTPHLGLHFEYLFHPYFSVGMSPAFNQRGFKSYHTYFLNDGRTLKTRQRVYLDYIDLPIRLICYPAPTFFVHTGPIISIMSSNRLFDYYQVYDGLQNYPMDNINYKEKIKVQNYYGEAADGFTLGWEIGGGAHVDDAFSVSAQLSMYEGVWAKGNGRPELWNTTLSVSAYYFFIKK